MIARSIRQRFAHWQRLAAVALLFASFGVGPALAGVQEIRVVAAGVDSSSMKASEKALAYAKARAVYLAARKMGVADPSAQVAAIKPEVMQQIVRGANVVQTRREENITYAEVDVSIVEEVLRHALKLPEAAAPEAPKTRGIMVMVVYVAPERSYLWEKENILRGPLADAVLRQSHGEVMVPAGDFEDLRLIDYQNALTVKPEEMKPMFLRYGTSEIILAFVKPGTVLSSEPTNIVIRRLVMEGEKMDVKNEVIELKPDAAEEKLQPRLDKAVAAIASAVSQIASSTAQDEQQKLALAKKISIHFIYANSRELARMQEAIRKSPGVLQLVVPSITVNEVAGTIYTESDKATLHAALVKQGILVRETGDEWKVSYR